MLNLKHQLNVSQGNHFVDGETCQNETTLSIVKRVTRKPLCRWWNVSQGNHFVDGELKYALYRTLQQYARAERAGRAGRAQYYISSCRIYACLW